MNSDPGTTSISDPGETYSIPVAFEADEEDRRVVEELLGRSVRFPFRVAVRDEYDQIVVIENYPFGVSFEPMPTWFWLVDPEINLEVSRLEAAGGVKIAEGIFSAELLDAVSNVYSSGRNSLLAHSGLEIPARRVRDGVGGSRAGVKCLHAHSAFHLAGGWSPIGSWVSVEIGMNRRLRAVS